MPDSTLSTLRSHSAGSAPAFAAALLAALWLLALPGAALAAWPAASAGLPVCTTFGVQTYQNAISDGAGGMFVAWSDTRFVLSDIYVQHVDASGAVLWRVDGALACGAANRQLQPVLVADGAGGIVVAWKDFRYDPEGDIFAQHIDAGGNPLWTINGVPLCIAAGQQTTPVIAVDSAGSTSGGVVVAWEDDRAAPRIYAQRLDATGAPMWALNGIAVSTSVAAQFEPSIVTAGPFGVELSWSQQGDTGYDIYAQCVGHQGQPLWEPAGQPICTAAGDQFHPAAVSDGASGAWVTWLDNRGTSVAVYAQHVALPGFLLLADGGIPVNPFAADQLASSTAADGRGGIVVAWQDSRVRSDIYSQRLDRAGTRMWAASGAVVSNGNGTHAFPTIASGGFGGALIVWEDDRNGGGTDIYAQRMDSLGAGVWTPGGIGACTATSSQYQPTVVSSPDSIGIVIWQDLRGTTDLYCQRVPPLAGAPQARALPVATANGAAEPPALEFSLAGAGRVALAIYDSAGRRVRTFAHATLDAGAHSVRWDQRDEWGRGCQDGVYSARFTVDGSPLATRSITIRR